PAALWMNIGHHGGYVVRPPPVFFGELFTAEGFGAVFHFGSRTSLYYGRGVFAAVTIDVDWRGPSAVPGFMFRPIPDVELSLGVDVIRGRPAGAVSCWVRDLPASGLALWK